MRVYVNGITVFILMCCDSIYQRYQGIYIAVFLRVYVNGITVFIQQCYERVYTDVL